MKVRNVKPDQYEIPAGYIDWKDYWLRNSSEDFNRCGFFACQHEATVVQLVASDNGAIYLIPLCYSCSKFSSTHYVIPREMLLVLLKDAVVED